MRKLFIDRPDAYTKFSGNFNYTKEQTEKAKNKIGTITVTKDNANQFYPNRIFYFDLQADNLEGNLNPLSYQYFMGTALPPASDPSSITDPAVTSPAVTSSSSSSVSDLRASQPTRR